MAADPYVYPGTDVLENKLGIRDAQRLQLVEYQETALRTREALDYGERRRKLDEQCWRGIHRILFQNIYRWAGRLRTVELSKSGNMFAPVRALSGYADRHVLPHFQTRARAAAADNIQFAEALAECWGELNFLHPFREGNGRATQLFVTLLARQHSRHIEWSKVDRQQEIAAAVAAGTKDYIPYRDLLIDAMTP